MFREKIIEENVLLICVVQNDVLLIVFILRMIAKFWKITFIQSTWLTLGRKLLTIKTEN